MTSIKRFKKGLAVVLAILMTVTLLPGGLLKAEAAESDKTTLSIGDESIVIGDGTATQSGVSLTYNANGYIITGSTTANTLSVAGGSHDITLEGVNIDVSATENACAFSIASGASVNLTLGGENSLASGNNCAGINVPQNAELSIFGTDSDLLTATSKYAGAGIGGNWESLLGTVTINGGNIHATSFFGAGIGGGYAGAPSDMGTVTINGGCVTASSTCGAGIGDGSQQLINKIVINGGNINATSKYNDGIGNGSGSSNFAHVAINGGNINASFRFTPKNGSGKSVYLTTVTLPNANTAPVSSLSIRQGGSPV